MTSDAKIGLLLGFVFILVIVSLVNGIPGLIGKDSSSKGINRSVPHLDSNYGFGDKAGDVVHIIEQMDGFKFKKRKSEDNDDPRYKGGDGKSKSRKKKKSDKKLPASKKKFYVVKDGDNLGKIARKVYGGEIGNKQATVDMIYQANTHILTSPDDLSIGQKLIMPSLDGNKEEMPVSGDTDTAKKTTGPLGKLTKAVKNVFGRKKKPSPLYAVYVVKDDDNLWGISYRKLGKGTRWQEIQKINNSILKGSKVVLPGMELKIPQK